MNLELPGFQDALAELLPKGLSVDACELDQESLRLSTRAPLLGKVVLVAKVRVQAGRLSLHGFQLEGAGITRSMILGKLRENLADLDFRRGPLHIWGDSDGSVAYLSWPS